MSGPDASRAPEVVRVDLGERGYDVVVAPGALAWLGEVVRRTCRGRRCCVVADSHVVPLYAAAAGSSLRAAGLEVAPTLEFPAGEASKDLATLGDVLEGLCDRGLGRDDVVVALGGGVTGDLAGLAAALYLRGIDVVQAPTSLLAMVDSSVGGKTAVDLAHGKNLAGAFWQPRAVVADVDCLRTVPPDLLRDSCGEVVKHALLADAAMLEGLRRDPVVGGSRNASQLADLVARNVCIKRDVVCADEREAGARQLLNLGHTIGHAVEAASGMALGHGSSVAVGTCALVRAEAALGWCDPTLVDTVEGAFLAQGLPVDTDLDPDLVLALAGRDKKRHADKINLVVLDDVARPRVRPTTMARMAEVVRLGCGTSGRGR